jgi:hypothetical protein
MAQEKQLRENGHERDHERFGNFHILTKALFN